MIEFKDVTVRRDGRMLFEQVSFQLHPGQKIGLTGNNGTGKSTLFAVLLNQLAIDLGETLIPRHWQKAHMAQEVASTNMTAIDYVLAGDAEWFDIHTKLEQPEQISESEIATLYQRFDEIDGYRTPSKAATTLSGLGFSASQHTLKVSEFSGGWRMRLNLARTLMCRADVMLLDEPTNHLDLDAILWLEDWIASFAGMVLLISHDQQFLDACVSNILHIEHQAITLYAGNYSQFIRTRSERLAQQQQVYEKQQVTRAHLENYIRRFKAKASKAKQAQSRVKQLERMADLAPVMVENPFSFAFYEPEETVSQLISLNKADIGYADTPLLTHVRMQVMNDTRLGLLGMNGAGKSTLIKGLVGDLALLSGDYQSAKALKLGYFNQHQMDNLDDEASPLSMLKQLAGNETETQLRAFLGQFDFRNERVNTPSKLFSGGERARLTLALIVWQRPNVLILDEPTNHLDLQMRQALTVALQDFAGAVVLVSHDRELVANVCDELYLVNEGKVEAFEGDLADYSQWLRGQRKQASQNNKSGSESKKIHPQTKQAATDTVNTLSKEELRKRKAEQRKLTSPIRRQIEKAEAQLEKLDAQLAAFDVQLSGSSLYTEARKADLMAILASQKDCQTQHAEQVDNLITAMEQLEEAEQGLHL